jgi:tetratricopeptide (TPR) repeat protein
MRKELLLKSTFIVIFASSSNLFSKDVVTTSISDESQNRKLQVNYNKLEKTLKFNQAVKLLSDGQYQNAITLFNDAKKYAKWPSMLNIAICYYKLNNYDIAKKELIDIINNIEFNDKNFYITISALYYLYLIDENSDYLLEIAKSHNKIISLSDRERDVLIDSYIYLKNYKMASDVLEKNISVDFLKRAILNIKLENHERAYASLDEYRKIAFTDDRLAITEWLKLYLDLKTGDINSARKTLFKYKSKFFSRVRHNVPMKISFNRGKVPYTKYLNRLIEFDQELIIESIFYSAPYVLSNSSEIYFNMTKGFLLGDISNIESLSKMVGYNKFLLETLKLDYIERAKVLKENLPKEPRSYMYYNLGLAFAQINDYITAYEYFNKAFNLNPSNKIFAIFTKISAIYFDKKIKDTGFLDQAIKSDSGKYSDEAQIIYKTLIDKNFPIPDFVLKEKDDDSLFTTSLKLLFNLKNDKKRLNISQKYLNDPLIRIINILSKDTQENYTLISSLQDNITSKDSLEYLNAPFSLSKLYFMISKATGTFDSMDLEFFDSKTYLRALSIFFLKSKHPLSNDIITKFENLQIKYELNDKESLYTAVALAVIKKDYESAYMTLALMENLYKDRDIKFMLGIRNIQSGDFEEAIENITIELKHDYLDIEILNLDNILKEL